MQDVPTAFWRANGVGWFDGACYTLYGPRMPCSVKTATKTFGKQTFCSFTKGWAQFCTTNELRIGDTVIFTWIGPGEFEVSKV